MSTSRLFPVALIGITAGAVIGAAGVASRSESAAPPEITMYKNDGCMCCDKWADHLRELGYRVTIQAVADLPQRFARHGVAEEQRSCHLAEAGAYIFVGHVPPAEVVRLLEDAPEGVKGLSVPRMPIGSYGMEVPGHPGDAYDVLSLDGDGGGATAVARYHGPVKIQ